MIGLERRRLDARLAALNRMGPNRFEQLAVWSAWKRGLLVLADPDVSRGTPTDSPHRVRPETT